MPLILSISTLAQARATAHRYDAVVSLVNPGIEREDFQRRPPSGCWLFLTMRDVAAGEDQAPSRRDVQALLSFYTSLEAELERGGELRLLVHCHRGVSRSPAAALILMARWLGPGREMDAAELVYQERPQSWPNETLLRYGDEHLGRHGALLKASRKMSGLVWWR